MSLLASCSNIYSQCGGDGWNGTTNCCSGLICTYQNAWYSQCLSVVMTTSQSPITATYYDDGRQNASTSIYWDCCKLSCGWPYKASVTNPARTCAQDGITTIDPNTQSNCNGGSSYLCIDQQPWNVSNTLSYGYAGGFIAVNTTCYSQGVYISIHIILGVFRMGLVLCMLLTIVHIRRHSW